MDRTCHSAQDVGDEPLLMAHYFPTWISANRYEGAQQAIKKGADIILLDDGLQHHTLKQDLKICVLNTTQKFGNQHVMPLGPLRENLKKGLERVDALVALQNTPTPPLALTTTKPLLKAKISLNAADCRALKKKALFAFAGLAHPGKFFDTLRLENLNLEKTQAFPDHYPYSTNDLKTLVTEAQKHNRHLVTTEKDWVRLPKEFQDQILSLRINVTFQNHAQLDDLLAPFLKEKK